MLPRGLVRLGLDTLDHCGSEIHQALSLYTSPHALPSIIHCTQGKDRTGKMSSVFIPLSTRPIIQPTCCRAYMRFGIDDTGGSQSGHRARLLSH